jgi:hypothetical protein
MNKRQHARHGRLRNLTVVLTALTFLLNASGVYGQESQRQLPTSVAGVNATSHGRLDFKLASGFILSGAIRSADGTQFSKGHIIARSGDKEFETEMTSDATYSLAVPAGTYTVTATVTSYNFTGFSFLTLTQDVGEPVTIKSDTNQDITFPAAPQTFTVSGAVPSSGALFKQGPFGTILFTSDDGKTTVGVVYFGSQYKITVPAGKYGVFTSGAIDLGDKGREVLSYLATRTTIFRDTTLNLNFPALVKLSGMIRESSGAPFTQAGVSASPSASASDDELGTAYSSPAKNNTTGQYLVYLPAGTYDLSSATKVDLGDNLQGALSFSEVRVDVRKDTRQDFIHPATGPIVTITGKITDSSGKPVVGATIEAISEKLTNAPKAGFQVSVKSNNDGGYSLKVLSGQYTIRCTPDTN